MISTTRKSVFVAATMVAASLFAANSRSQAPRPQGTWWKGNLHAHTLNSDGDSTPDDVVRWYREQLASAAGVNVVRLFREAYPDAHVSATKALDLVLWQIRDPA